MALHMSRLNRKQARRREALGRFGNKLDTSLMTSKDANTYKEGLKREREEAGQEEELNAHAFEDLTDFEVSIRGVSTGVMVILTSKHLFFNRMRTLYTAFSLLLSSYKWTVGCLGGLRKRVAGTFVPL